MSSLNSYEAKLLCKEILKKYKIVEYLQSKGVEVSNRGYYKFAPCVFHLEKTPSMQINENDDGDWFHCYGCCKTGNIITLYSHYENKTNGESIKDLGLGIDINYDLSEELLKQLDVDEEDDEETIKKIDLNVSLHTFLFLRRVRKEMGGEYLDKEFDNIHRFFEKFDKIIGLKDMVELTKIERLICESDFLSEKFEKIHNDA